MGPPVKSVKAQVKDPTYQMRAEEEQARKEIQWPENGMTKKYSVLENGVGDLQRRERLLCSMPLKIKMLS